MKQGVDISFVRHDLIDREKWDDCIRASGDIIYGYWIYLETMATHWDALIEIDPHTSQYDAVMPLTWNKKFGITYLFQPFLTPQGGIFSRHPNQLQDSAFLDEVMKHYKFAEINLNIHNHLEYPVLKQNDNYFLSLDKTFEQISGGFNNNLTRNYKKAIAAGCEYRSDIPLDEVLALAETQLNQYARLKNDDMSRFRKLCDYYLSIHMAQTIGVYLNNQLISSCIFLFSNHRVYYILAGNHAESKNHGASHFLLHEFIRENAGKDIILDFTGSNFPSIAFFYECFGAGKEHYFSWKMNRLPVPIRWLKK